MPALLQRLTAWLCLGVALLTGLAPAQGFVLCFEPDGGVCFAVPTVEQRCGGCRTAEAAEHTSAFERVDEDACCACTDFALPGRAQEDCTAPGYARVHFVVVRIAAAVQPVRLDSRASAPPRAPPRAVPRPPDVLVCIGCDVLLV
ncbi:MAG: hypothetical protein HZA53_17030 [Planctomycetes bacterium]|nr:hypothetical protein [Planctomycetota bacterium]